MGQAAVLSVYGLTGSQSGTRRPFNLTNLAVIQAFWSVSFLIRRVKNYIAKTIVKKINNPKPFPWPDCNVIVRKQDKRPTD
jgi:hypothetical protein